MDYQSLCAMFKIYTLLAKTFIVKLAVGVFLFTKYIIKI